MKNIILIGMPGCGKTTIGKKLGAEIGVDFIDLDDYVINKNNMTIPEIFKLGEEFFRNKESEAVNAVKGYKNTIISTGGGVVKRSKNMDVLRAVGYVVFIDREPEKIIEAVDISTRPLLKDGREKIVTLYKERYSLYKKYCDVIIDNNGAINSTVEKLKELIKSIE